MRLSTLGENINVQWTIRQMVSEFQLRRHTHTTALPMVVNDTQNLLLRCGFGRLSSGSRHSSAIIHQEEPARDYGLGDLKRVELI